jgi:hypothetical protein
MKRAMFGGLALAALAGCGSQSFAERDPKGYEACSTWAGYASKGDVTSLIGGSLVVADLARESSSKAIRRSVSNLFGEDALDKAGGEQFGLLDREKFEAACKGQGFDF